MATMQARTGRLGDAARGGWRRIKPALLWLGAFGLGMVWLGLYLLLRFLDTSKRAVAWALLVVVGCAAVIWALAPLLDFWILGVTGILVGVLVVYGSHTLWGDYHARLLFLAESQPWTRLILIDGDLRQRWRSKQFRPRWLALLVAGFVLAWLIVNGWALAPLDLRASLVMVAGTVTATLFVAYAMVVAAAEREAKVRYYIQGLHLTDPVVTEQRLADHWPRLRRPLAWRAAVTGRLTRLWGPLRPVLRPAVETTPGAGTPSAP